MNKKYIIFGAGHYGCISVFYLGKENVEYIVDNDLNKKGHNIEGVPIYHYSEKANELREKNVIVSVRAELMPEILEQLKENGVDNVNSFFEVEQKMISRRLAESRRNIEIYNDAISWIENNTVKDKGIINNTNLTQPYPEVTGYFIPSLMRWGKRDMAISYAKWLCSIQKEDGSWWDTDDKEPFIFDTAQILKGLLAVREIYRDADKHIIAGCDWLLGRFDKSGRLLAVNPDIWGDNSTYSELIHIYCLSPLKEAGEVLKKSEYTIAAKKSLKYYIENEKEKILDFHLLSHFYAYVIEGLVDMGETALAKEAMQRIATIQAASGAVPAYKNVRWVCSTGLFQFALIWFKLGDIQHGEKAFDYACRLQNKSGGWYGSYPPENGDLEEPKYLPDSEISWAVKYFLDALEMRGVCTMKSQKDFFYEGVQTSSSAYVTLLSTIREYTDKKNGRVLDIGCGKGVQLKNLLTQLPNNEYYAVDILDETLEEVATIGVKTKKGRLTAIPYKDSYFNVVYTCEALEHAVDISAAIKEMARVTQSYGIIMVIDKYKEAEDEYVIDKWEQYFDEDELKALMYKYCSYVKVVHGIGHSKESSFMSAWIGKKS